MSEFLLEVSVVIAALFLGLLLTPSVGKRRTGSTLRRERFADRIGTYLAPRRGRYRH